MSSSATLNHRGKVLGIDLGTSNSSIAWINDSGESEIIPVGNNGIIPSIIYDCGDFLFIGKGASDIVRGIPYHSIKNRIGDPNRNCHLSGIYCNAAEISAAFIHYFSKIANEYLLTNKKITSAIDTIVISVPARFNQTERVVTKRSAEAAGLKVLRVINEPTAAAIATMKNIVTAHNMSLLIFDLGGGTFDLSAIRVSEQNGHEVVLSDGIQIGGNDWNDILSDIIHEKLPDVITPFQELTKIKEKLSVDNSISHAFINRQKQDYKITIPRDEFERRSRTLIDDISSKCSQVLDKAKNMGIHRFDTLVLVGGSSRMPMIENLVQQFLENNWVGEIKKGDYEFAVAKGAALYSVMQHLVKDISPKAIAMSIADENDQDCIEVLISKNTPLPAKFEENYSIEKNAKLELFEGDIGEKGQLIYSNDMRQFKPLDKPIFNIHNNIEGDCLFNCCYDKNGILNISLALESEHNSHDFKTDGIRDSWIDSDIVSELIKKVRIT
jgi:molecular chaperone DnaK